MSAIHENTKQGDSTEPELKDSNPSAPSEAADQDEIGSPNDPVSDPKKPSSEG